MAQLSQALVEPPPQGAHPPRRFYQPELDGLRFYAFLGVFVYHTLPEQPAFYGSLHFPCRRCGQRLSSRVRPGSICSLR